MYIVGKTDELLRDVFDFAQLGQSYYVSLEKPAFVEHTVFKTASKKSQMIWHYPKNAENATTNWYLHIISKENCRNHSKRLKANTLEKYSAIFGDTNLAGTIANELWFWPWFLCFSTGFHPGKFLKGSVLATFAI